MSTFNSEVWAVANEYPDYAVSNQGRIMRITDGRPKSGVKAGYVKQPTPKSNGYLHTTLSRDGIKYTVDVHKLVAVHHVPNEHNLPEVNHKDGNKENCVATNLEWVTSSGNKFHAFALGLSPQGSAHPHAKLTEENIPTIRQMLHEEHTQQEISELFGVSQSLISRIAVQRIWKHVEAA